MINLSVLETLILTSSVIKQKGSTSKRVFQENKARQIFRKTNIFYPLIRTRACAYQGVKDVRFSENLACFVFLSTCSEIRPFALLPTTCLRYKQYAWIIVHLKMKSFRNKFDLLTEKIQLDILVISKVKLSEKNFLSISGLGRGILVLIKGDIPSKLLLRRGHAELKSG